MGLAQPASGRTAGRLLALDRRAMMLGLGGGGLALGFGWGRGAAAESAGRILNAYVEVTPADEVLIYTPGAEMGQGVAHALPKIVAEEMDADWSKVGVRLSPADVAFLSPVTHKQRSANSDGVKSYYDALRKVGAGAREMLIQAAAARWRVEPSTCRAEAGWVVHASTGRRARFGDLAADAARLSPPQSPRLKEPSEFRLIGRSFPRKDLPPKVDGSAVFGIDVRRPGMLYAAVRHCPMAGGRIGSFDRSKLLAQPGVKAAVELETGVAAVATSFWAAKRALEAIDIKAAPPVGEPLTTEGLRKALATALSDDAHALNWPTDIGAWPPKPADPTPTLEALKGARRRFEAEYEVPYLAHAPLEPPCCTAQVTAEGCTVWAPSQAADEPRRLIAKLLDLPLEHVRFERTFLGGGFGRKWESDFVLEAVKIARASGGAPVKLVWTREEDLRNDPYRPAYRARFRVAVDAAGRPAAVHGRIAGQSIYAARNPGWPKDLADPTAAAGLIPDYYDIPHRLIDWVEVKTPLAVGYWRSVTQSQNCFFGETVIDELAHQAGVDPVAYRDALLSKTPRMRAVLRKAAQAAGWGSSLPPGHGRGVALSQMEGSVCAQVAEVEVSAKRRLRVRRVVCAFDCGLQIEPDTIAAQLEGGIVFGLTAALYGSVNFDAGQVREGNFDTYRLLSLADCPQIETILVTSDQPPSGVGEAAPPPVMPAVANAIFAATGVRLRRLPIAESDFKVTDA